MWCVGRLTDEYRERMYALLELYNKPYNKDEPVICIDEKSKQLLMETRSLLPMKPGSPAKQDYEYKRAGVRNIFVAVEPQGKHRIVEVTELRAKPDFVSFVKGLLEREYSSARTVNLVLDNLNTHFRRCFDDVLGHEEASRLLSRVNFYGSSGLTIGGLVHLWKVLIFFPALGFKFIALRAASGACNGDGVAL